MTQQQQDLSLKKELPIGIVDLAVILLIIFWSRMTILKLAESPNAKVVVIGSSENGLPIILGESK